MQPPLNSSSHSSQADPLASDSEEGIVLAHAETPRPALIQLSEDESVELLRSIGQLAQSGMPLDEGLEAFAAEVSGPKLKRAFLQLAQEIRAGGNPFADQDLSFVRLPQFHQSLLVAGIQSNRLGDTLYDLLDEENWRNEYWRDLWAALSYPFLLALITLGVVDLLNVVVMPLIQTEFLSIYEEFELDLPFDPMIFQARSISWTGFFLLGLVGIFLVPACLKPPQVALLRRSLPLVGKIFWWYESLDMIMKLRILISQGVPTSKALRLLEDSVSSRRFAQLVPIWAEEMESGKTLADVWQYDIDVPSSILPLVRWGEATGKLGEALQSCELLLKDRLSLRRELIRKLGPPLITTIVLAALFWAAIRLVVLVMPMFDLLSYFW
ncbi:hypothetical protein GC197_11590 [bacterium]|nr:hypothetical protein [bacterium]